jgi:hypothetical protein
MSESLLGCISDTRTSLEAQAEKELDQLAKAKAREIAEAGQTFEYIFGVWQKRHHGDAQLGKALLYSLGCQSVSNASGIHVAATGDGGYGKSDGIKKMGELVYPTFWKNGGFTPQTLYYSGSEMPDGVVVGLEDVVWNSDLGATVKRITTDFQEGALRVTTVEMKGVEVRTAKRIAFWTSCVDSQADEQIRDRFIMYNVRSDSDRRKEILKHMMARDEGDQKPEGDIFETKVCQVLTYDLKQKLFNIKIPFASKIKFEGDPRAYGMFSDMIRSSAVFRYRLREEDEANRLVATIEDFENAKSLYVEIGGHDRDKYTDAELKVLNAIAAKGGNATQADIQEKADRSSGYISDILNGRGKQGHGLLYKCKDIIVEDKTRPIRYRLRSGFNPVHAVSIELEEPT